MNSEIKNGRCCTAKAAYIIAVLGAILIVAFLNRQMKRYTQSPPLESNRGIERAKALSEIRNAEDDALKTTGWVDPTKGIVRLRIEDAMQLMEREWKNPAAARSNLLDRVAKAYPPPPPPAPAKPSQFE